MLFKSVLLIAIGLITISLANTQYLVSNNSSITPNTSKNSKIFTREYTYNASEDDSQNSSRNKAITQIKVLLSEEVGTHIESSFDMKETAKNGVSNQYIKSEINSLSASITKLKILDENWNGATYYIKANVEIDEEQTMILLIEAIKSKASEKDVKRLNSILKEQNGNLDKSYSKIQSLQKKLVMQEIKNQASKKELSDTKILLQQLKEEKQIYDNKVIEQISEISRINILIKEAKKRINNENENACLVRNGMTKYEVNSIVGEPKGLAYINCRHGGSDSYDPYMHKCENWYYGTVQLVFKNGILRNKIGCK
jgi:hypothetical protein